MKIAIAGYGDVAKYLVEVFCNSSHDIVLLSGRENTIPKGLKVEQRRTSYKLDELCAHLADCDAVVSTLSGPNDFYTSAHTAILEACTRSENCKKFLPSEFAINIEDFPDLPASSFPSRTAVRGALRAQHNVQWTLLCMGWFMDYLLPSSQRHLRNLDRAWMIDHNEKTFDLYGDGSQMVSLTSARDVARVMLALLEGNANEWTEYTCICAQAISYRDLYELWQKRTSGYMIKRINFSEITNALTENKAADDLVLDELRILGFTNASHLPEAKCIRWDSGLLEGIRGRDIETLLNEAEKDPDRII